MFFFISFFSSSQELKKENLNFFVTGEALGFSREKDMNDSHFGFYLTNIKDSNVIDCFEDFYSINDSVKILKKNRCKTQDKASFCEQAVVNLNTAGYKLPLEFSEITSLTGDTTIIYNTQNEGVILNYSFDTLSSHQDQVIKHSPLGYYFDHGSKITESHYLTYNKNGQALKDLNPFLIEDIVDSNAIMLIDYDSYEHAKIVDHKMAINYEIEVFELFELKDTPEVYVPSLIVFDNYQTVLLRNKNKKWYDPVNKFAKRNDIDQVFQLKAGFDDFLFEKGKPLLFVKTHQK